MKSSTRNGFVPRCDRCGGYGHFAGADCPGHGAAPSDVPARAVLIAAVEGERFRWCGADATREHAARIRAVFARGAVSDSAAPDGPAVPSSGGTADRPPGV